MKATAVLLLALARACAAADYPEAQISKGVLQVRLLLPDAQHGYYRGTRFDWSGAISSLQFAANGSTATTRRFTMPSWGR